MTKAVGLLLTVPGIAGQCYNCYDLYIAEEDVAEIAKRVTASGSKIERLNKGPRNQIDTSKLRALGMTFGVSALLEPTIRGLIIA